MGSKELLNALAAGYDLHWYRIERVLGQGAFGITYLAHDINLERPVAVKEYMPSQLCARSADLSIQPLSDEHKEDFQWGLTRFITEARTLTKFEHPNLVRVFNVFELNNTAYMIMNYEVGESLQQILKRKKSLSENELIRIMIPLMKGLELIHEKGFIHRDIKPGNVFIRTDGSPVLLDFGSARQTRGRGEAHTLTNFVSPGYAPIEQYSSKSDRQGPWTDIYGLGATLYKAITGISPTTAIDRSEMIMNGIDDDYKNLTTLMKGRYSEKFLAAIDHALAFNAENRPKTIAEWRDEFDIDEEDIETMRAVVINESPQVPDRSHASTLNPEKATTKTVAKTPSDATTINVIDAAEELSTLALSLRAGLLKWFRRHKYPAAGVAAALLVAAILFIPGPEKETAKPGATVATDAPPKVTAPADTGKTPAAPDTTENTPEESEKPTPAATPKPVATSVTEVVTATQADAEPETKAVLETKTASKTKAASVAKATSETKTAPKTKATSVTKATSETKTASKTKAASVAKATSETKTAPKTKAASVTKATSETKTASKTKTASVTKPTSETKTASKTKAASETKVASETKLPPVISASSETKLPPVTTVAPEPATVPETKTAHEAPDELVAAAAPAAVRSGQTDSKAKQISQLLRRAKTDFNALRLTKPKGNNAYEHYQKVLSLDKNNEAAKKGIQSISDRYVTLAYGAMDSGRRRLAWIYLSRARKLTPASPAVAKARVTLRKQVKQAEQRRRVQSEQATQTEPEGEDSGNVMNNVVNWLKNASKDAKPPKKAPSASEQVRKSLGGQ